MNKDLERRVQQERRKKAAHKKTISEMRHEGAAEAGGDLARNVAAAKRKLKAAEAVRTAMKDK